MLSDQKPNKSQITENCCRFFVSNQSSTWETWKNSSF